MLVKFTKMRNDKRRSYDCVFLEEAVAFEIKERWLHEELTTVPGTVKTFTVPGMLVVCLKIVFL